MKLGCSTFSFLHVKATSAYGPEVAASPIKNVDLLATWPDVDTSTPEAYAATVARLRELHDRHGVRVLTVNPLSLDLNIVSPEAEMRAFSEARYGALLHLAVDVGAEGLVMTPGRLHAYKPVERSMALDWIVRALERLSDRASALGLSVWLENIPTAFAKTGRDLQEIVGLVARPNCHACYDVANGFMVELPEVGIRDAGPVLDTIHFSDTTSARWRHDPIGRGDVDFAACNVAMADIGFAGTLILETVHETDFAAGIARDLERLRQYGVPV